MSRMVRVVVMACHVLPSVHGVDLGVLCMLCLSRLKVGHVLGRVGLGRGESSLVRRGAGAGPSAGSR